MSTVIQMPGGATAPPLNPLTRNLSRLTDIGLRIARDTIDAMIEAREQIQPSLFGAEPEPEPVADVAPYLSPSQVHTYLWDCSYKWYCRKVLHLAEQRGSALGLGSAVHAALGENFRQKIETKEDLPPAGAVALFREAWAKECDSIAWAPKEDEAVRRDLCDAGTVMVDRYVTEIAPAIEPAAVEMAVSGEIGGVPIRGYVDLVDVHGNVVDLKTAKKRPSGIQPDYRFQVATYAQLLDGASGTARLDTMVKSKTIQLVQQTFAITDVDVRMTRKLYPLAQEGMRSGLYTPNRSSNLCNKKYCSFWRHCQNEFGGEVRGEELEA